MKIYAVTFNKYTNCQRDTVTNRDSLPPEEAHNHKMIHAGGDGKFLVTEDQIIDMLDYGGGIRNMEFVGNLYDSDDPLNIKKKYSKKGEK